MSESKKILHLYIRYYRYLCYTGHLVNSLWLSEICTVMIFNIVLFYTCLLSLNIVYCFKLQLILYVSLYISFKLSPFLILSFNRLFIWRSILRLPENHVSFSILIDKGTHNAFARLHENYPIKSRRLLRSLERWLFSFMYEVIKSEPI